MGEPGHVHHIQRAARVSFRNNLTACFLPASPWCLPHRVHCAGYDFSPTSTLLLSYLHHNYGSTDCIFALGRIVPSATASRHYSATSIAPRSFHCIGTALAASFPRFALSRPSLIVSHFTTSTQRLRLGSRIPHCSSVAASNLQLLCTTRDSLPRTTRLRAHYMTMDRTIPDDAMHGVNPPPKTLGKRTHEEYAKDDQMLVRTFF